MPDRKRIAGQILAAGGLALFLTWVWPTPYIHRPIQQTVFRIHRVSGAVQICRPAPRTPGDAFDQLSAERAWTWTPAQGFLKGPGLFFLCAFLGSACILVALARRQE